LAEWKAWFNRGRNRTAFLDDYDIPRELRRRKLSPRFILTMAVGRTTKALKEGCKSAPSFSVKTRG
jgi:hypothetical protein